jgi:hypothetical protein
VSRRVQSLVGASCVAVHALGAQPQLGKITGVVFDSLFSRAPLAEASILIDGLDRSATTDKNGTFTIDSVPAGAYRIAFFHPSLDRAGVQVAPAAVAVAAGSSTEITLATPNVGTVALRRCGAASVERLLFGLVLRARGDAPVSGAAVRATWVELGPDAKATRRTIEARTSDGGGFMLCDPPGRTESRLLVDAGDGSIGVATFFPGAPGASVTTVRVPPEGGDGRAGSIVLDASGAPLTNATIEFGAGRSVRTDSSGRFALSWSGHPTTDVVVRAVGMQSATLPGDEFATVPAAIAITMVPAATTLADVKVRAERKPQWLEDFEARRQSGLGSFVTRTEIEKRNPSQAYQMLFGVPGIQINTFDGRPRSLYPGTLGENGPCEVRYFVDGIPFADPPAPPPPPGTPPKRPPGPLVLIPPTEIEAMEIYPRSVGVPPQFGGTQGACGTILIWTRRGGAP